jgi:ParB family chromosome partitioning protein
MLSIDYVDPALLRPSAWNPNVVSAENEVKLEQSLDRLGTFRPVLVRTLPDGALEIVGGHHRAEILKRRGEQVPIINLGAISDEKAKEIALADNARFGSDDSFLLSNLLKSLGNPDELLTFLPFADKEMEILMSDTSIDLDALSLDDAEMSSLAEDDDPPILTKTHQLIRVKVPIADAHIVEGLLKQVAQAQGYTTSDSLTNLGDALVHLCKSFTSDL